jgi:hypothetical protein
MLARSAILGALLAPGIASTESQGRPIITTLSADSSLVTGGDVLVEVAFAAWMEAYKADGATPPSFFAEALVFSSKAVSKCTELYPVYSNARLKQIFPGGVFDWTKPGVNQVPVSTWASFGPSPKNLIAAATRP